MGLTRFSIKYAVTIQRALEETVAREGRRIFQGLMSAQRTQSSPSDFPTPAAWATQALERGAGLPRKAIGEWNNLLQLPSRKARMEQLSLIASQTAASRAGEAIGVLAPNLDVEFVNESPGHDSISFPSAPVWVLKLSLKWWSEILRLAAEHPLLPLAQRQWLFHSANLGERVAGGVEEGSHWKRMVFTWANWPPRSVKFRLEAWAFESLVRALFDRPTGEKEPV